MTLKPGTRVINDYLGPGEVVRDLEQHIKGGWLVLFDTDPPYDYNMSLNPTYILKNKLKLEVKNGKDN